MSEEMKSDWRENLVGYRGGLISVDDSGDEVILTWPNAPTANDKTEISWHVRYNTDKPIKHVVKK